MDQQQFDRASVVSVGEINAALGLILSVGKLAELGFHPVAELGAARYFRREAVPSIAKSLQADLAVRAEAWK